MARLLSGTFMNAKIVGVIFVPTVMMRTALIVTAKIIEVSGHWCGLNSI